MSLHEMALRCTVAHKLQDLWVQPYDGHANPEQWLTSYAITMRAGGGDIDVMANYLPVMLQPTTMNWLTSF